MPSLRNVRRMLPVYTCCVGVVPYCYASVPIGRITRLARPSVCLSVSPVRPGWTSKRQPVITSDTNMLSIRFTNLELHCVRL